jgi:hypothetical protein
VPAEAVPDRGELGGGHAGLVEQYVQARAGQPAGALRVVPEFVESGHHGVPVGHRHPAALIVQRERDVAQLGQLICSVALVVIKAWSLMSDEHRRTLVSLSGTASRPIIVLPSAWYSISVPVLMAAGSLTCCGQACVDGALAARLTYMLLIV